MSNQIEAKNPFKAEEVRKSPSARIMQESDLEQNSACRENANTRLKSLSESFEQQSIVNAKRAEKFKALVKALPQLEGKAEEAMYDLLSHYGHGGRF